MVIAIMLQMCTRLGLIKCKRQGEPLPQGYRTLWCCHLGSHWKLCFLRTYTSNHVAGADCCLSQGICVDLCRGPST